MNEIRLKDGDQYKNKHHQRVLTLRQDYDGFRWYWHRRDSKGVTKTLSVSAYEMVEDIKKNYQIIR